MTILPKYQTFLKRVVAGIIDGLVFVPFNLLGQYLLDSLGNNFMIPWAFFDTITWTLYCVVGHGKYGQTLGKKAMAIQVLDLDEKNTIGYKRAFIRESVWFFTSMIGLIYFTFNQAIDNLHGVPEFYDTSVDDFLGLTTSIWFILEIVTMFFNSKRRALHDYMAGSVVVDIDIIKREEYIRNQRGLFDTISE